MMSKRRGNNEGSITYRKKEKRWQGSVINGFDYEKNKPTRKYFYDKTRKGVVAKVNEALGKIQAGNYRDFPKIKLSEWLIIWLEEYMKPSLRPTTYQSYEMQVKKHILPKIGHLYLNQVQPFHLQTLYNDKLKDGARLDGKPGPLSPRSVRYIHMICHACFEQAKKENMIAINPADAVKLPHNPKKDIKFLDIEQVKIFLSAARQTRHFPAYFLALNTGIRRGELLALRWKDVDMSNGTITINRGLVRVKGGLIFQEPKTKLSNRVIGISKEVINVLKTHKKKQNEEKLAIGKAYQDQDLVFCNEIGQPLCPRGFTRQFERLMKSTGLEKMPFHALRHTFATLSLQQGTDPRTIQEALGHHKVAFTLDTYSAVTAKMKKESTDKIGCLLASCLE